MKNWLSTKAKPFNNGRKTEKPSIFGEKSILFVNVQISFSMFIRECSQGILRKEQSLWKPVCHGEKSFLLATQKNVRVPN